MNKFPPHYQRGALYAPRLFTCLLSGILCAAIIFTGSYAFADSPTASTNQPTPTSTTSSTKQAGSTNQPNQTGSTNQSSPAAPAIKPTVTLKTPELTTGGITLNWTVTNEATSFVLFRKSSEETTYQKIATLDKDQRSYLDTSVQPASSYQYYLQVFYGPQEQNNSFETNKISFSSYLSTPQLSLTYKSKSATSQTINWSKSAAAQGYRIDYSTDRLFRSKQTITASASQTTATITNLKPNTLYYLRIRSFLRVGNIELYSRASQSQTASAPAPVSASLVKKQTTSTKTKWVKKKISYKKKIRVRCKPKRVTEYKKVNKSAYAKYHTLYKKASKTKRVKGKTKRVTYYQKASAKDRSRNIALYRKTTKTVRYKTKYVKKYKKAWVKVTNKKKKNVFFEIKKQAGQKLWGYDTVQGSASDGTYLYYVLYNRELEQKRKPSCRIAKFRGSDLKLMRVSQPLNIEHGNCLTYDSHKKRLLASHCKIHTTRVSYINPQSLKVESSRDLSKPTSFGRASYKAPAVAYCAERKTYVAYNSQSKNKKVRNFAVYDANMKPVTSISLSAPVTETTQGLLTTNDYLILAVWDSRTGRNYLRIYDWDGTFISRIRLNPPKAAKTDSYELESVYFYKGRLYASFYDPYYGKKGTYRNNYVALIKGI